MTNSTLRQKSVPVQIDPDVLDFAKVLTELMWEYDGV